jgi:hypothetical protein
MPSLTSAEVWRTVSRASFAVLSHVTPAGAPRSSGVVYQAHDGSLFVSADADSWKARHIAVNPAVAVTVTVPRGGPLSLVMPIPPATVSFPAVATVHPAELVASRPALAKLVPSGHTAAVVFLEIRPTGHFVTYGVGVSLRGMLDPAKAHARVPVG